jgi:hypothetical protein
MNATKIASLVAGVAVIAIAAFATSLPAEARAGLLLLGGFLCGYPMTPPGAGKPVGATLALLLALSPALPACSSSATPEARGAQAAQAARLAYNAAAVSVQALITVQTAWTDAIEKSGDVELAKRVVPVSAKTAAALDSAAGALGRARQYLEAGESEAKVRQQLREAVGFADLAVELLGAAGRPLPDKALEALDFLRGFLGAAPTGAAS